MIDTSASDLAPAAYGEPHGGSAVLNECSETTPLRILIASDNCILRRGVASILCGVVSRAAIGEVSCFRDARERLGREEFFAAIFDIDMGDLAGPSHFQMLRVNHA